MIVAPDPSERFIQAAGTPLVANLSALWASDPVLADAIESLDASAIYPVEASKAGPPTLSLQAAGGSRVFLHSRHQPIDEANRLIDSSEIDGKMVFHVLGLGLGYHLERLFERASDEAIFCVFENDLRMIRTALEHCDLSRLLSSHRILWFYKGQKAEFFQRLAAHIALVHLGTATVTHAPSLRLHEAFFRNVQTWLGEYAAYCRTTMNTVVLNSRQTAQNIARNIGWYAATPGLVRLHESRKGQPAVIVSAGPSLRKNKHLLRGLESNAVIIAVQTTLQPLLEMGVEPHFVTSLDYHEICTRFFEKLPANLRTELIAEPKATPAIFQMMTGPTTLIGCEFADSLLREMKLEKPGVPSGATVAHLAFYLAEYLGCDPIIFVGQDLGFSDGLCYTPGTSYEDVWRPELSRFCSLEMKQWEQIVRERPILRQVSDYRGRPMYTEERLFAYLQQFERDFARSPARIIDATEGGVRKNGTTIMPLAEAISQFCSRPLPARMAPPPPPRWEMIEDCRTSILRRKQEAGHIERISRQTLPLLEEIRDNLIDQTRVNRLIIKIDRFKSEMEEFGKTYEQVIQFTQESEIQRFRDDRNLAAARLNGMDKQKRQVQRDVDNVRAVIAAAEDFQSLMDDVAERLSSAAIQVREAA